MQHLSIGEVEARTGLTARALRLYETRGLLSPGRTAAAQALLKRWNALVSDFQSHATPEQQKLASEFWGSAGEWGAPEHGEPVDQPITGEIIDFIRRAGLAKKDTR